jgi:hypothetical protein
MSLKDVADFAASAPTLLEALMLLCCGAAWPVANLRMLRMLRVRRAEGKGLGFTLRVLCGYLAGASAKLVTVGSRRGPDPGVLALPAQCLFGNGQHRTAMPLRSTRPGARAAGSDHDRVAAEVTGGTV